MRNFRLVTLLAVLLIMIGYINYNIWLKERLIVDGQLVLLALQPVDPRSLLQGDYMVLDYALLAELDGESRTMIVTINEDNVAFDIREDVQDVDIAANEHRLKLYEKDDWRRSLTIGTNSYFFEEGTGDKFETAVYGGFRVADDGTAILVHLYDDQLKPILP